METITTAIFRPDGLVEVWHSVMHSAGIHSTGIVALLTPELYCKLY